MGRGVVTFELRYRRNNFFVYSYGRLWFDSVHDALVEMKEEIKDGVDKFIITMYISGEMTYCIESEVLDGEIEVLQETYHKEEMREWMSVYPIGEDNE